MTTSAARAVGFYSYIFATPLGFVGHLFSIMTFLSKDLRCTSTSLLFIVVTFSDLLYLLVSIRDVIAITLELPTIHDARLCRFRDFTSNFAIFTSSYSLVLISIDRFIRVYFPYQTARICTRRVASYSILIVCLCAIAFTSHVLQPGFSYTDPNLEWCGPPNFPATSYSIFFYDWWNVIHRLVTYLAPSCMMFLSLIFIKVKLHTRRTVIRGSNRRERLQQQMLIMMLSAVVWFIISTLPYSMYQIYYFKFANIAVLPLEIFVFYYLLHMNYCFNFYIYCLTSRLFRQHFLQQLKRFYFRPRNNADVYPLQIIVR